MKFTKISVLFTYSFVMLQISAWKTVYSTTSAKLDPAQSSQDSVSDKSDFDHNSNKKVTIEKPYVKQRSARDLMSRFMSDSHRAPMASFQPYNRPVIREHPNPPVRQGNRGSSSSTRYRQAMSLPSGPVQHQIENRRPQSMVMRNPSSGNPRPQAMSKQPPVRAPALRNQPNTLPIRNEGIPRPPNMHSLRQASSGTLDTDTLDILGSSSSSKVVNQKSPNRVIEVVHHIPMPINPPKLKQSNPAVVYISKPNFQLPQSMLQKDVPQMISSQIRNPQNRPAGLRGQELKGSNPKLHTIPLKNEFQNPHFVTSGSRPHRQHMQVPHLRPETRLPVAFLTEDSDDHRNLDQTRPIKKLPQNQNLRVASPNANVKNGFSSSFMRPVTPTRDTPRINRLKQELNAEIQELLKLVPHSPVRTTKKPTVVIQQHLPNPFLIPSQGTRSTSKQIKSGLNLDTPMNLHDYKKTPVTNVRPIIRQPQFQAPENEREKVLGGQTLTHFPPPPLSDGSNDRPPVVPEASLDSEELSKFLKNLGYDERNKFIHNAARTRPVKLIIPDDSDEKKTSVMLPTRGNSSPFKELPSLQNTNLSPSKDEDIQSSDSEYSPSSQLDDLSPPKSSVLLPAESEESSTSQSEYLLIYDGEKAKPVKILNNKRPSTDKIISYVSNGDHPISHKDEDLARLHEKKPLKPLEKEHLEIPVINENSQTSYNNKTLSWSNKVSSVPSKSADTPSPHINNKTKVLEEDIQNEKPSPDDVPVPLNNSNSMKTYWDFRKLNGRLQTQIPQTVVTSSPSLVKNETEFINHNISQYQGEESIASISVKEEFPMEEEIRKKYSNRNSETINSGTLHDIYNKKILDERKRDSPSSHPVRYFPQHYVPYDTETVSEATFENTITSTMRTTETKEREQSTTTPKYTNVSTKKVPDFLKPKERIRNIFPALNSRDKPTIRRTTTMVPKYLETTRNINFYQKTTPKYFITKTPTRHQHQYGQRNIPKNENGLVRKYVVPSRQHSNDDLPQSPIYYTPGSSPYITPQTFIHHTSSPRYFRFKPSSTEATVPSSSGFNSEQLRKFLLASGNENPFKYFNKTNIFASTDNLQAVRNEFVTTESQIQNTQTESSVNQLQFSPTPEMITIGNKQFFRGPQHSITFNDFTTNSYQRPVPNSMIFYSQEVTTPSTASVATQPFNNYYTPYNQTGNAFKQSTHSQNKVTSSIFLPSRVFGRKNHTSFKHPFSTTKMPELTHKFSYAPVNKPSTAYPLNHSEANTPKRIVFNFRTGTTESLPHRPSSAIPKVIYNPENRNKPTPKLRNDTLEFVPSLKDADKIILSPKNSSKTSLFQHVVFSQPNISSKSKQNESTVKDTNKDLYGILKPITKPSNISIDVTEEGEIKKLTTKVFKVSVISTTTKSTTPFLTTTKDENVLSKTTQSPFAEKSQTSTHRYRKYHPTSPPSTSTVSISTASTTGKSEKITVSYTKVTNTKAPVTDKNRKISVNLGSNTTVSPSSNELVTEFVDQEQMIVDSLKSMKLKMQDMASKGLRHLMPLVMDLSSDLSVSSDCTFSLLRWLRALRTMEQWAVRMMDASSKMPEGILYGTFSTFGSYDECIAIKTPKANLQMPYSGQYCSVNIQPILPPKERHFTIQNAFKNYPKLRRVFKEMNIEEDTMAYYYILKHRIGLCVPSTCSLEDLGNVTEKMAEQLRMKISVERCETSEKPKLTKGQIISMTSVFIAFGIVILATIVDISLRVRSKHEMDIDEIIRKKNGLRHFSYVFSAYSNARRILDTSIPTTHLSSLHGIKFLSITWVMLGHVYYCKDYLTLAGLNKVRDLGSNLAFQVVLNSAFAADTFFFLSGLLVVYSTFIYMENNNGHFTIVGFYIRRYWRLTPAFLMISGVILLGPLAGSGPIWHETLQPFVSGCENYWWTNLFYFSNFVPTAKTCVPHGWFLSCDMQFYVVAPVIILALYRRPKVGILLLTLGILSSMITTGFLTYLYNLPPVSLFALPDPTDINEYLDTVGYKPYAHYASYCIGMATGFLLAAKQKLSISRCLQVFGWVISTTGCCLVIYGTWNWNSGELPGWPVSVAYATTSRTVWCLGVAWLTVVCYAGHGGLINSILSWHGFIPLSRLSYLAYLIHPLLMYLYASYVRSPFYFSQYVVVYLYLGHLCVTFGLSFLFSLAFEVPFLNMEKLITKYLDKSRRKRRASFSHHHNNWQHPEHPEMKDSVVLMRRRPDKFLS